MADPNRAGIEEGINKNRYIYILIRYARTKVETRDRKWQVGSDL